MKFSKIPYKRYEIEKLRQAFSRFSEEAEKGTAQLLPARKDFLQELGAYREASALAKKIVAAAEE